MAVSIARTLNIPDTAATYGAVPTAPSLAWPMANPGDVLDYSVDLTALLADPIDAIASASVAVAPVTPGGLTITSVTIAGDIVTAWMTGGVPGTNYSVLVDVLLYSGRKYEFAIGLLMNPFVAPSSYGPAVTAIAPFTSSAPYYFFG